MRELNSQIMLRQRQFFFLSFISLNFAISLVHYTMERPSTAMANKNLGLQSFLTFIWGFGPKNTNNINP